MPGTYNSTGISKINRKILAGDPASPAAGFFMEYPKSDGFYFKDSAGAVQKFAASAGGMADAVILAPGSSARNTIQPTGDFKALIIKNNAAQTVAKQEWQASDGTLQLSITSAGDIVRSAAAGTDRLLVFATAGVNRFQWLVNSAAESGSNAGSDFGLNAYSDGGGYLNTPFAIRRSDSQTVITGKDAATNSVPDLFIIIHNSTGTPAAGFGTSILLLGESSTTENRNMGRLRYHWTVATDASRTARGTLSAYDTAERDCIAFEASGTASMVAFHGAAPIVRPANANEAAVAGTAATQTTPWGFSTQAQADGIVTLVNAIRQCLVDYNLWKGAA